ncbi:hypothetical protein OKA05_28930 [Luteolibacter arcticus]|uniref:Uncharacterized protein n=1 Tax=Luteolibacter arcticus TaxID=1581411 RepID=A0ABT3GSX2_9BACT|nr:hypothetical protein [Luteolibacter arcticus]MCW1926612.1 hypothetical protein [Luteolibacter arcticus]
MITRSIPAEDVLVAHELAALEICELRRKGIPYHLEEHADRSGRHLDVVRDSRADRAESAASGEER